MILCDEKTPRSLEGHEELAARLGGVKLPDEIAVCIGGDGFMLHCVRKHGLDRVYLGLNAGHLGFLLNEVDDWDAVVERLVARAWNVHSFPLLEATIHPVGGGTVHELAINDVYLERMTGQTARIALTIDGHEVVDAMVADGIIFSTALGSTAYSFSAGGAPCHPEVPIMGVTAICPHLPKLPPFVLPASARARVDVRNPDYRPVRVVVDGTDTENVEAVDVHLSSEKAVRFAYFAGRDLTATMVRKIVRRA